MTEQYGAPVRRFQLAAGVPGWLVTGYAEARTVLSDPRVRKDSGHVADLFDQREKPGLASFYRQQSMDHLLNSDPPRHTRLRRLVTRAFSTGRVEGMRAAVTELSDTLLDRLDGRTEVDLIAAYAVPLPTGVICELLGVPPEDHSEFRKWTSLFVSTATVDEVRDASVAMDAYMRTLIKRKREQPDDRLISSLIEASADGERLTEDEAATMAVTLLTAGHETTVNLIGNGTLALLTHPEQFAALRADRSLLPAAIDEFMRYDGPVNQATVRFTTAPMELGGVRIPADEFLVVNLDAANHDPREFPDPDALDFHRGVNRHVAFGHGLHFCLGAQLARLEGDIAFTGLLDRFADLELAVRPDDLEWNSSTIFRGLRRLPVRLHRAAAGPG